MPGLWGGPGAMLCGPSGGGGRHVPVSLGGGPISLETALSLEVGPPLVESILSSAGYSQCGQCWTEWGSDVVVWVELPLLSVVGSS